MSLKVGVVGATGMVGEIFLDILAEKNFPIDELRLFASEKSAGTKVMDLSIALAAAESRPPIPGKCSRCQSYRNPQNSTANYSSVFCSKECEQEFVRTALAGITLEDCVRMHRRLENFLMGH